MTSTVVQPAAAPYSSEAAGSNAVCAMNEPAAMPRVSATRPRPFPKLLQDRTLSKRRLQPSAVCFDQRLLMDVVQIFPSTSSGSPGLP